MTAQLRVVTFNVWVRQPAPQLHRNLMQLAHDTNPDVMLLQEARNLPHAVPGYKRWAADLHGGEGADQCVILVRRGVPIVNRGVLAIDGPRWTGPHSDTPRNQPPRVFPWVVVRKGGQLWDVMDIHRTWVGKSDRNVPSWRAEDQQLDAWADQRWVRLPNRPRIMGGDHNGTEQDRGLLSLRSLAKRTRSELLLEGIDGYMVSRCRGHSRKLAHGYGSDGHRPVVADLVAS